MTNSIRRSMLSLLKQILIQSLLYKTITCLTQPASTFFVSQMKRTCLKQPLQNLNPTKKWKTNIRQQCIKSKLLSSFQTTVLLVYNAKVV